MVCTYVEWVKFVVAPEDVELCTICPGHLNLKHLWMQVGECGLVGFVGNAQNDISVHTPNPVQSSIEEGAQREKHRTYIMLPRLLPLLVSYHGNCLYKFVLFGGHLILLLSLVSCRSRLQDSPALCVTNLKSTLEQLLCSAEAEEFVFMISCCGSEALEVYFLISHNIIT